jgi:hypothetical protein
MSQPEEEKELAAEEIVRFRGFAQRRQQRNLGVHN